MKTRLNFFIVDITTTGINLADFVKSKCSLGRTAWANIQSFKAINIPLGLNSINLDWHRNLDFSYSTDYFTVSNSHSINFVNINTEYIPELLQC